MQTFTYNGAKYDLPQMSIEELRALHLEFRTTYNKYDMPNRVYRQMCAINAELQKRGVSYK